ncbi:family 10 glycosylhydrolase [Portibacter lacus]|uniref:Transcriptional initiation protein Tat n=1 Tax=Portibacter lacus TaxID=1099794 RepID=A0AA37SM25_9BACT|nr:family 10 glycosylhydrolase [Portibacter lacus]GLR15862.1 transcriptional initiation protein Tat [Portibacter lacus]
MKKRTFLKTTGIVIGGMPFLLNSFTNKKGLPKYWVWLRPSLKTTDSEWVDIFKKLKESGVQAVLPQIYSSSSALFEIEGYTVQDRWLERIIPIAQKEGIEIHAWMWTMICNDSKMLEEHPDYYVVNRKGESAATSPAYVGYYKFLCPRRPEVRAYVQHRVKTLASIPGLSGVHLDYVRMPDVILAEGLQPKYNIVQDKEYPEYDYCYCDYCRSEYKKKSGIDPMEIEDPENDADWYQFRYDAVNDMVNNFLVPEARSRGKKITAAVFPNWESVRQQWHKWDLDGFLPMLYHKFYNAEYQWIGEEVVKAKDRLQNDKPVYAGMFIPHLKGNELVLAYEDAKSKGADGFALFAHGNLKDEDYVMLKKMTK